MSEYTDVDLRTVVTRYWEDGQSIVVLKSGEHWRFEPQKQGWTLWIPALPWFEASP